MITPINEIIEGFGDRLYKREGLKFYLSASPKHTRPLIIELDPKGHILSLKEDIGSRYSYVRF